MTNVKILCNFIYYTCRIDESFCAITFFLGNRTLLCNRRNIVNLKIFHHCFTGKSLVFVVHKLVPFSLGALISSKQQCQGSTLAQIPLAKLETYPHIKSVYKSGDNGYIIDLSDDYEYTKLHIKSVQDLRQEFISKAVVSSNIYRNTGSFFVLMIFEFGEDYNEWITACLLLFWR